MPEAERSLQKRFVLKVRFPRGKKIEEEEASGHVVLKVIQQLASHIFV
jgi:hypothetical protein